MLKQGMEWIGVQLLILSAGITCINGQSCSSDGQLRLFQTTSVSSSNAGRVEICMGGMWGTIAADSSDTPWNEKNAQVACIQLGFNGTLNGILPNTIPFAEQSSSPIHLSSVLCDGTESNITSCSYPSNVGSNVGHGQDAFVVCRPRQGSSYSVVHPGGVQSGDIRLFGDTRNGRGAVQIYSITMGWQGICPDSSWTDSDATTICRDLGYNNGSVALPVDATSGPGGQVPSRLLYDAKCPATNNDDIRAGVCSFRVQRSPSSCTAPEGRFAAVQCNNARDQSVRLIGGSSSREGIVEIAYNGRWGMVCNTDFGLVDARIICKGLGYGDDDVSVMTTRSSTILASESNLRPIWLDMLSCSSSDSSLSACVRDTNIIGYVDCLRTPGSSIAAVDCGDESSGGLSGGAIAGIVIGCLIAVGLLVFVVTQGDKQKKQRHAAAAARARAAQSQSQPAPTPAPPPEPQPAPQPAADPESNPREPEYKFKLEPLTPQTQEPSAPQPSAPEMSKPPPEFVYDVQPDYPTNPQDEPPPYPGGPSAPAAYPAAGYPQHTYPVSWSSPAYPPASAPYPVTDTHSTPYPP